MLSLGRFLMSILPPYSAPANIENPSKMLHFGPNLGSNDMAAADNKETLAVENGNFQCTQRAVGGEAEVEL